MRHGRHRQHRRESRVVKLPIKADTRRSIHFDTGVWRYRISKWWVIFWSPKEEKTVVSLSRFTGWSWYGLERAAWKGGGPKVGPSEVKAYIVKHLGSKLGCPQ